MNSDTSIKDLLQTLPQIGRIEWIGLRPARRAEMRLVQQAELNAQGIVGDRYSGSSGKRAVTLIQAEHLPAIAAMLKRDTIDPELLRRNIVISGINLLALKDKTFLLGSAELEMTGLCHPCSRMEEIFGAGGYNAVRGHGGITACVRVPGKIKTGDALQVILKR
jgi:MOSC domain-containing protein YiiM